MSPKGSTDDDLDFVESAGLPANRIQKQANRGFLVIAGDDE